MRKWLTVSVVAASLLVAGATAALASNGSQDITVVYRNLKLVVNGITMNSPSEPFIYNGTTYLPVRAVSEALGQPVKWDGDTGTIYVGKLPEGNFLPEPFHTSGRYYRIDNKKDDVYGDTPMTMAGVKYAKGLQVSTWDYGDAYSMDWNLNGQYETLSAVIGLDDADNKNGADIVLSGDDQPLKQFTLKPGDLPQQLTLSVHGVLHLSATVNPHKAGNSPTVDFANAIVK